MTRFIRQDFIAVNGKGVTVYSFGDLQSARSWAKDNSHLHDGLRIDRLTVSAEVVYRPRLVRSRPDFAIPQWGAVSPVCAQ